MTNKLSTLGYRIVPDVLSQPSLRQWLTVLKPIVESRLEDYSPPVTGVHYSLHKKPTQTLFRPPSARGPIIPVSPRVRMSRKGRGKEAQQAAQDLFRMAREFTQRIKARGVRRTRSRQQRGSTETVGSGGHCERRHRMCGWPILVRLFLCTVRSMYQIGYTYLSGHVWHVTASCFDRRAAPRDDFNVRCRTSLPQPHRGKHSKILSLLCGSFLRTWMETTEGCEF